MISLGKDMAAHSIILAWRIPWTEEPRGLQPMGSQRVGHDSDYPSCGIKEYRLYPEDMLCLFRSAFKKDCSISPLRSLDLRRATKG